MKEYEKIMEEMKKRGIVPRIHYEIMALKILKVIAVITICAWIVWLIMH